MWQKYIYTNLFCLLIALNFYYEGVQKLASLEQYADWLRRTPVLKMYASVLLVIVPFGQILLAIAILWQRVRITSLYLILSSALILIAWVMYVYLCTGFLFWPYHAWWGDSTWMQKIIYHLIIAWISLIIIISNQKVFREKTLRNNPAITSKAGRECRKPFTE